MNYKSGIACPMDEFLKSLNLVRRTFLKKPSVYHELKKTLVITLKKDHEK